MKPRLVLIANPSARRASCDKLDRASSLLAAAGYDVVVRLSEKRGDAEAFARQAAGEGAPRIVAAGGDGTFNEVVNGIAGTDTAMAILPLGTTNVLAKELGIPESVEGAIDITIRGNLHSVSLGAITCVSDSSSLSRYFILMAGIGFDAETVFGVDKALKRASGKGAYIVSGLKTLRRYSPAELVFSIDGDTCSGYAGIIGNASRYGGPFRVTPDARIADSHLYVCVMRRGRRIDLVRYVIGIVAGVHLRFRDVTYRRAQSVMIEGGARIQIDGDYLGLTPATISAMPEAVKLIF